MEIKHILKKLVTPATFISKQLVAKLRSEQSLLTVSFILIGAVARVIPHLPNFTPIGAMALFGGAYMSKKQALTLPILAMILSDLVIGFDSWPMRLAVYGSFLLMVLMGMLLKNRVNAKNTILFSLGSSILFFVITNFAVWAFGGLYPHSFTGLTECYFLAVPFFRNTLLGDLFYSGAFFGGYELISNRVFKTSTLPNNLIS